MTTAPLPAKGTETCVCFDFDCIVTDPPYDMIEAVEDIKAVSRNIGHSNNSDTNESNNSRTNDSIETRHYDNHSENNSNHDNGTKTGRNETQSRVAVEGVLTTLFAIASKRLKVGGRLVFFAPHRSDTDFDGNNDNNREDNNNEDQYSHGIESYLNTMDIKMGRRKAFKKKRRELQKRAKENLYKTTSNTLSIPSNSTSTSYPTIPLSLLNTTSFYERNDSKVDDDNDIRRIRNGNSNCNISENENISVPFTPIDFLPSLPSNLNLTLFFRQVMSPTFSRWLCVVEKIS